MKNTIIIDRVNWKYVPDKDSVQKKALRKAVTKAGNCLELSRKIDRPKQVVSRWLNKKCDEGCDLMHPYSAALIEKVTEIKGIAGKLCPKSKKEKKLHKVVD